MMENIDEIKYSNNIPRTTTPRRQKKHHPPSSLPFQKETTYYQDVRQSIEENLKTVPPEIRRVLLLGFSSLVLVFKEINIKKSRNVLKEMENEHMNPSFFHDIEDKFEYSRIPSIPFGAVRILWSELLNVHRDNIPLPYLNTESGSCKNTYSTRSAMVLDFMSLQSWGNYITSKERDRFIAAARMHSSTISKSKDNQTNELFDQPKNVFGRFVQNLMKNYEDPTCGTTQCLADAVTDFMRDTLVDMGLIQIAHVSPRNLESMTQEDDLDSNEEDSERETSGLTDWLNDHRRASIRSGLSTVPETVSCSNTLGTAILLDEERRKRKMVRKIMKGQTLSYLIIKSDHHYQYGLNLFEIPITYGGFLSQYSRNTFESFNEIMAAACLRQRKRVELANLSTSIQLHRIPSSPIKEKRQKEVLQNDRQILEIMFNDASLYGIRLLPSHLMHAKRIPEAISLLQDPTFLQERLKMLMVREVVSRTKRDQKELQLRKYKRSEYKSVMVKCFVIMKECLIERHPIAGVEERGAGVINENQVGEVGEAFHSLARALDRNGWTGEAIDFYNDALKYKSSSFGPKDISLSKTLHNLGCTFAISKKYSEAAAAYQQALAVESYSLGKESYTIVETYTKIAAVYSMIGDYCQSVSYYEDAILTQIKLVGKQSEKVPELYSSLGVVHTLNKKYDIALFCFKEALQLLSSASSQTNKNPPIACIHYNIGLLHYKLEQYSTAINHYHQALTAEEIPETASAIIHSMGLACIQEDNLNDAVTCFQQSIKIIRKSEKANEKDLVRTLLPLAKLLSDLEQYEDSLSYYKEGKHIIRVLFGESQKYTSVLRNIAFVYGQKGDTSNSLSTYGMALHITRKEFGPEHIDVADILYEKACILFVCNDVIFKTEAMELYEKSIEMKARLLGNDHADVAIAKNNLGVISLKMRRFRKALSYFIDVLQIKQKKLGRDNEKIADTLQNIGLVYKSLKEYDLALEQYEKAYVIRKLRLDNNDPKVYDTLYSIAIVLSNQWKFRRALETFEKVLQGYIICGYNDSHPNTKNAKQWVKFMNRKLSEM